MPEARHAFAAWLEGLGFPPGDLFGAVLILSELVTNGVIHDGGDDIVVEAETSGTHLHVEVVTAAAPADHHIDIREKVAPEETGRGLALVAAVCDRVATSDDVDGRRTVTCMMTLGP